MLAAGGLQSFDVTLFARRLLIRDDDDVADVDAVADVDVIMEFVIFCELLEITTVVVVCCCID